MTAGWALAFSIGGVVVVVVVLVVLTIIWLASRIRDQTDRAVQQLVRAEAATAPLWEVRTTVTTAEGILAAARRVREREEAT
jgi:hypothetical protein